MFRNKSANRQINMCEADRLSLVTISPSFLTGDKIGVIDNRSVPNQGLIETRFFGKRGEEVCVLLPDRLEQLAKRPTHY